MGALIELIGDLVRGKADPLATAIVAGVLLVAGFFLFCCRFIKEGEQAAILRFGRFKRVAGPGFVVVGPPWRSLQRLHIRQNSLRLAPQAILLRDGIVFNVVGVLVYKVADIYKALFEIADLQEAMADVGSGKLREVVGGKPSSEMWDVQGLRSAIIERLRQQEEEWGVVVIDFLLTHVEPAQSAQQLFLLEELARRRLQAARITLEGFRDLGKEVGLPPGSNSPLWAALAGMNVSAIAGSDGESRTPSNGAPDTEQLGSRTLQAQARKVAEESDDESSE